MSLTFNAKTHRYRLDGKPVTGVTTLISGGIPKPALPYWAAKSVAEWVAEHPGLTDQIAEMGGKGPLVAFLKGVPWQKRDDAGARGTDVHDLGEKLVHGEAVDVPERLAEMVGGYARFLDLWQPVPVLTEKSVANRKHWYAVRFDLIADIDGVRWLLDLKTAKGVYGDNCLQTEAYRSAEFYVTDEDPETEIPIPEGIERLGVIHIREDGSDLVPLDSSGEGFKDFIHCAFLAKRKDQREGYVHAALTPPEPKETAA